MDNEIETILVCTQRQLQKYGDKIPSYIGVTNGTEDHTAIELGTSKEVFLKVLTDSELEKIINE